MLKKQEAFETQTGFCEEGAGEVGHQKQEDEKKDSPLVCRKEKPTDDGNGQANGKPSARKARKKRKKPDETAEEGIRRLAFGDIRDAVRLLYTTPDDIEILDSLDLYTVSELKRGKDGQLEMKFYDRLKALQYLMEAENGREHEESRPLYEALKESALLLSEKYRGKDGNVQEPQKENGKNED